MFFPPPPADGAPTSTPPPGPTPRPEESQHTFRFFSMNGGPIIIDDPQGILVKATGVSDEDISDEELGRITICAGGAWFPISQHPFYKRRGPPPAPSN